MQQQQQQAQLLEHQELQGLMPTTPTPQTNTAPSSTVDTTCRPLQQLALMASQSCPSTVHQQVSPSQASVSALMQLASEGEYEA